jgi:hypothetical protein
LQTLKITVISGGSECRKLNGELERPDHSISFHLDDLDKKSQFFLLQTNWPTQDDLPKSETLSVVNIGGDGTAPCVTIESLIHILHSVLRNRSKDNLVATQN